MAPTPTPPTPGMARPAIAARTTLELVAGRVVVAKQRATTHPARAAIEAEGRWLAAARVRGVVRLRLVSLNRCRLETHHAGLATLRTGRLGPAATARALGEVAGTLADLHRLGLVHGNLSPDHVVLAQGGGPPMLCSPAGSVADPAADLEGLSGLMTTACARWDRPPPGWADAAHVLSSERHRLSARHASTLLHNLARRHETPHFAGVSSVIRDLVCSLRGQV